MPKTRRKNKLTFARTKKELEAELGGSKKKKARRQLLKVRIKKTKVRKSAAVVSANKNKEAAGREEELVREAKELYWQAEREKRMVMWSGVTFFMLLIVFFWFYNLKQIIESNRLESANNVSLEEITGDMGDKFIQMKKEMTKIKEFAQKANSEDQATSTPGAAPETKENTPTATTAPAAVLPSSPEATSSLFLSGDDLEKLKEKIEEKVR